MSVTYQLAVTPAQAESYLANGLEEFCGFAVDADAAASITNVSDLIDLLCCDVPGAPFKRDEPLYILRVPTGPFVQARLAVGPLHESAFFGGFYENPPFDGSGITRAPGTAATSGIETPLYWLDPTRLTSGSQLWRFTPGAVEPEIVGVYHGVAWGWENITTGQFTAAVPSPFIGPVTTREWGVAPVDVEVKDGKPSAVTIVAPVNPPEGGFQQLPSGMWAKRIEYYEGLDLFENQVRGRLNDIPVRIIRPLRNEEGNLLGYCIAMLLDAQLCLAHGHNRLGPGTFGAIHPMEGITNQDSREARPNTWDVESREAVTLSPSQPHSNSSVESLINETFLLVANIAPTDWEEYTVVMQIVGNRINFGGSAKAGGEEVQRRTLPTAFFQYAGQIKALAAKPDDGAPLSMTFVFTPDGNAKLSVNYDEEPMFASEITREDWETEISAFPRANTPSWLDEAIAG